MAMLGRSLFVSPEPFRGLILCLLYRFKDVLIQPFVAHRAIVTLDIGVLLRLAWPDVCDVNVPRLSPCFQKLPDVFGTVIDTIDLGDTAPLYDLVQAADDTYGIPLMSWSLPQTGGGSDGPSGLLRRGK